jgi:glycosidase
MAGPFHTHAALRIIEISIPHFTPSGTFAEAITQLQAIADDGFEVVFLLPIMPINAGMSKSPYATTALDGVRPDLGTWNDWIRWLTECHRLGLQVVLDIPLNHTSPAHDWVARENFYRTDEQGHMHPPIGTLWTDVVQLNHDTPQVEQELNRVIRFWLDAGVDGFRYDAASFMPKRALQNLIRIANNSAVRKLHHWCDSRELFDQINGMTAFLDHEGVKRLSNGESLKEIWSHPCNESILYLTNHDSLHQQGSALQQWGLRYTELLDALLSEKVNVMQSFAEWRDPSSSYSFLE